MKLVVISGRSGAGKGTALNVLEDIGFFCIDNLPAGLIPDLVARTRVGEPETSRQIAVSVDARNFPSQLRRLPEILDELPPDQVECEIIFLDAENKTLVKRFSETRRRHPLGSSDVPLIDALEQEKDLLDPIASRADLAIDTTDLTLHQLRDLVRRRIAQTDHQMSLLFESFGFRNGVPVDVDFVFDVRCLPNPHWDLELRPFTGQDPQIIEFLDAQPLANQMFDDLVGFLDRWLPHFRENNRSYMTVGIGCTGGKHRSVYLAERLGRHYSDTISNVQVRHREQR